MLVGKILANKSENFRGVKLELSGPGIFSATSIYIEGIHSFNIEWLLNCNKEYPKGVDTFIVDLEGRLVGIPRSVKVKIVGGESQWDMWL